MKYGEFVAMDGGEVNLTTAVDGGEVGINSEIDGSEIGVVMTVSENNYNNLSNKPSINGVTLVGDKTTADLLIESGVTSVNGMDGDVVLGASDVGALPDDTFIPSNTSDLNNDSGFISTETDPTVPSWAKASSKPSYTASEVGAVPTTRTVNGKALSSDITLTASDVSALPSSTSIPSKTSDLQNDSGFISHAIYYGTSASAAADTTKVVTCADFTSLTAGSAIVVEFSTTNSAAVADLMLNVNGTGAKGIRYINNGTRGNLTSAGYLKANTAYLFVYDGDYWVAYFNYNTTYSSMTDAEITAGTGTTARTITPARLKTAVQTWENVHSVNGQTGAVSLSIPTVPTNVSSFNNDAGYLTLATLPIWDGSVT